MSKFIHPQSRIWWGIIIILCLALEGAALYYQYVLDYWPCVLCIHVRMLLALLLLIAIFGWIFSGLKAPAIGLSVAALGTWVWMTERSYQLLATERGWSMGECGMASGLPEWLALEKWFPWLFQIHEPCGYTPYVLFEITMAEALLALSVVFTLLTIYSLFLSKRDGV